MNTTSTMENYFSQIAQDFGATLQTMQEMPQTKKLNESNQAAIYSMACTLMQSGHFDQAAKYFQFLAFYAPTNADYYQGWGTCARELADWPTAAHALGTALYLEPESNALALLWAETLLHLELPLVAKAICSLVMENTTTDEESALHHRAHLLIQSLEEAPNTHATA